jgi:hypothetical protein
LHRIRRHHQYAHSVRIDLGQPVAPPMCSDVSYNPLNQIDDHLPKELLCGHKKTTMISQLPLNHHNLLRRLGADQREMAARLVGAVLQPHLQAGALAFQDRTLHRITLSQVRHQSQHLCRVHRHFYHMKSEPDDWRWNKPGWRKHDK